MNLVQNPHFTDSPDPSTFTDWTLVNGIRSSVIFRTAPYAAQINNSGTLSQTINTNGGQTYMLSFWTNYIDPLQNQFVQVSIENNAPSVISTDTFYNSNRDNFFEYMMYFTPPVGSTTSTITFNNMGPTTYVDDVSVTATTIIQNGGFEFISDGTFNNWNGGFPGNPNAIVHSGTYSATISNIDGIQTSVSQINIPVVQGANYKINFYATQAQAGSSLNVIIDGITYPTNINKDPTFFELFILPFTASTNTTSVIFEYTGPDGGSIYIDDVAIILISALCFSGESVVHVKNIITNEISDILVEKLDPKVYHVYNTINNTFFPVLYNIVSGTTKRFIVIEKNLFADNMPSKDFYVTSGHKILFNGIEIKSRNIPGNKKLKVKSSKIYTIVTEERMPILINNLPVMTYGYNEWINYANEKNLQWSYNL
jgi:hypothetical protein